MVGPSARLDTPCIIDGDVAVTPNQLDEMATRLASGLTKHVPPVGAGIGVRLRARHEWFVVNRAIAKLRGTLVAIDWRASPQEVARMLANASMRALICDDQDVGPLALVARSVGIALIVLEDPPVGGQAISYSELLDTRPDERLRHIVGDAPIALFTSGTTAPPREAVRDPGMSFRADAVVREYKMDVLRRRHGMTRARRELLTLPLHHGMGSSAAQACIRSGGTLVIHRRFDPEAALRAIEEQAITHWSCVPTMLYRLAALPASTLGRYDRTTLQSINVGAAPFATPLKRWALEFFGPIVCEGYGTTETGPATLLTGEEAARRLASCGRPYRHVELSIVDDAGVSQPPGTIGRVLLRTPITHVESTEDMFDTGDLGWIDEDRFLFITGRRKDVIVSGGVNIHPREIEEALLDCPGIFDAAVVGEADPEFGENVIAYCEIKAGTDIHVADMLKGLRSRLAHHKVPRRIIPIDDLPRNSAGKVDKAALRRGNLAGFEGDEGDKHSR